MAKLKRASLKAGLTSRKMKRIALVIAALYIAFRLAATGFKPAAHVEINGQAAAFGEYIGARVTLLCRQAAATGSWYAAVAVRCPDGTYSYFSPSEGHGKSLDRQNLPDGVLLVTSGNDPVFRLNRNLTDFYQNIFILTGRLTINKTGEPHLKISSWQIAYPISGCYSSIIDRPERWHGRLTPVDFLGFGLGALF